VSKWFYYCPQCKRKEFVDEKPIGTISNPRDGCGKGIYYYKCEKCGCQNAGFMLHENDEAYCQIVIDYYYDMGKLLEKVVRK